MGKVYTATHTAIRRLVAIKILHPDLAGDQVTLERFRREAEAAATITHPNAIVVIDFGVTHDNGMAYIVMELLEGRELRQYMSQIRWFDFKEAFNIFSQVCSAVHAAHQKGIIHRDLKPDNIYLVKSDSGTPVVKVLDFGIAKLKTLAGNNNNLTQQGTIIGTPKYMSPEQCLSDELDARSDVYSLGVILYEMLTGKPVFEDQIP